jgi:heptosyltransferase-1
MKTGPVRFTGARPNMHILLIKTSSLGDVIHTLPALTDAQQQLSQLQCDWLVEESFAEIPHWHPIVRRVIPVALRQWRKQLWRTWSSGTWQRFIEQLTQQQYDYVIDAQGLLKSAWLTYLARGRRCGFDYRSAREALASWVYQQRYLIPPNQHAVTRLRQLLAAVLKYTLPQTLPDYGIRSYFQAQSLASTAAPTLIFLHGTTWATKHWPDDYWLALTERAISAGYQIRLPWGNSHEQVRAQRMAAIHPQVSLIPKGNLYKLAGELFQAKAVVGVDTGIAHLAAALAVPSLTLYGATQPTRTGTYGSQQRHLQTHFPCAPCLKKKCIYRGPITVSPACYQDLSADKVWQALQELLSNK